MRPQPGARLLRTGRIGFALAAALAAAGCELTVSGGPGEGQGDIRVTFNVTNVGTGSGGVFIAFPAGVTVQEPCPQVLGPGESCSPFILVRTAPMSISVQAQAATGSDFIGWEDPVCGGSTSECDVTIPTADDQPTISLEPRFDLEP